MSQNLQNFVNFQKIQLENLVDFEKCCKTRIFLQKSVPIQPKTSNTLPKINSKFAKIANMGQSKPDEPCRSRTRKASSRPTFGLHCGFVSAARRFRGNLFLQNFEKNWRARSRLYRNEFLQENTRRKALAEIFTMHAFALL